MLFATEVLEMIGNSLPAEFESISCSLTDIPSSSSTLFLVQANQTYLKFPLWSYVAQHLVESKWNARFIILISEYQREELKRTPFYPLLKPYCSEFAEVYEDPTDLLEWITQMKAPRPYKERKLPELLFIAAVSKMEGEWLEEKELSDIMNSIRLIEVAGQRKCYFPCNKLPIRFEQLLNLYCKSIGLTSERAALAKLDPSFYLGACLSYFLNEGQERELAEAATRISASEAKEIDDILKLLDRRKTHQDLAKVLSFLYSLGLLYTIAEETGPPIFMGIKGQEYVEDPVLRKELEWVDKTVFPLENALTKQDWKHIGKIMQQHTLNLAASGHADLTSTSQHIESIAKEFLERLKRKSYSDSDCKSLLLKTVKTAYLLECSAALSKSPRRRALAHSFLNLWSECWGQFTSPKLFSDTERTQLRENFKILSELNTSYKAAVEPMNSTLEKFRIIESIERNEKASDRIDDFFNLYASFLKENDFFVDTHLRNKVGPELAKIYIELNSLFLRGLPPFSSESLKGKELNSLIASLPTSEFDRIFILIIDAMSYLDWKLNRNDFNDLDFKITEGYQFSIIPTYTPCALTALITGYHPSITGIFDWKLRTSDDPIINLYEAHSEASKRLKEIHLNIPKMNSMTLIHSLMDTPLTQLHESLANLNCVCLRSDENESAVTHVQELIRQEKFNTEVVAIYIHDFDKFGHEYLKANSYRQYYSAQSDRIKNDLLHCILKQAHKTDEKILVVLTADHGKLMLYESRILKTVLPETKDFQAATSILKNYENFIETHERYIAAWVPDSDVQSLQKELESKTTISSDNSDALVLAGLDLKLISPHESQTPFINPNMFVISRFDTRGKRMAHGGASLSEIVVPAIRFEC